MTYEEKRKRIIEMHDLLVKDEHRKEVVSLLDDAMKRKLQELEKESK